MYNMNENFLDALPFKNLVSYEIELLFETSRDRIHKLMTDHRLIEHIKENNLTRLFDISNHTSCQYYDEEQYTRLEKCPNQLNVFLLNVRSLPKHGGELVNYLNILKSEFHIIILTEIGSRNLSLVENLFPTHHSLQYITPINNPKGGVGIYISKLINDFDLQTQLQLKKKCECTSCEFESLFINFDYDGYKYLIVRYPPKQIA